ncbi:hypothetical protein PILCRDRAFT_825572, partial [Piloderma croceum F 1598]
SQEDHSPQTTPHAKVARHRIQSGWVGRRRGRRVRVMLLLSGDLVVCFGNHEFQENEQRWVWGDGPSL